MKAAGDPLTRIAARIADGERIDWDAELARSPALVDEIRGLRWIEAIKRVQGDHPGRRATDEQDEPPLAPGDVWGRLEVIDRIGQGSAGHVFRAFDPELGREVALKILRENAVYRSTGTEARHLKHVDHPAVLRVLGWERHRDLAGMWTDFLDGVTLEDLLSQRGPFQIREACRVGIALCEALEAVHAAGMVHRDVKTSNVMWLADESVVLIDFGSVKVLPHGVPEKTSRIRGTPLTMAPEIMVDEPVGRTADIYSLGVLLYRLASGEWPVDARTFPELFRKIDARESVPIRERLPDCDPAFADLVDRALAWEPEGRPQSATAFREALEQLIAG